MKKREFLHKLEELISCYREPIPIRDVFDIKELDDVLTTNDVVKLLNDNYIKDDNNFITCNQIKKDLNINVKPRRIGFAMNSYPDIIKKQLSMEQDTGNHTTFRLYGLRYTGDKK